MACPATFQRHQTISKVLGYVFAVLHVPAGFSILRRAAGEAKFAEISKSITGAQPPVLILIVLRRIVSYDRSVMCLNKSWLMRPDRPRMQNHATTALASAHCGFAKAQCLD